MAGKAIIFCAPSGSGKTTIVKHLLQQNKDLGFSISAVTRDKRGRTEVDGKDYHFLSPEEFKKKIDSNSLNGKKFMSVIFMAPQNRKLNVSGPKEKMSSSMSTYRVA